MTIQIFVVDTNVVVAGLITTQQDSPVAVLLDAMLSGAIIHLLSPKLLSEYRSVLLRPRLGKLHGLSEEEIDRLLVELTANAIWREPASSAHAPDRGDDHLWELLHSFPGSILITGDRLLIANPPERDSVMLPRTFFERFQSASGPNR